jgi:hypothetical protein
MTYRIDHLALAVLDGFWCPLSYVQLTPEVGVVRLDALDPRAAQLVNSDALAAAREIAGRRPSPSGRVRGVRHEVGLFGALPRFAEETNHALQWEYRDTVAEPFNDNYDRNIATRRFDEVVTALRVLKPGPIGRLVTRNTIVGDPAFPAGGAAQFSCQDIGLVSWRPSAGDHYVLEQDDVPVLQGLLEKIRQVRSSSLQVALSRLNRQYGREDLADRLIDALIAFEALYLRDARGEFGYRLALRVAAHLGDHGGRSRTDVFELLQTAYAWRGKIAHGVIVDLSKAKAVHESGWPSPNDLLTTLTDLLRMALRLILVDTGEEAFNADFHDKLDRVIVAGIPSDCSGDSARP